MAVYLSPGVFVNEIDLTTVVPQVSVSTGALAGVFRWGPVGERFLVDSENTLVRYFGKPTNFNAETFFTAANFLAYTNLMYVVRAANTSGGTPYGSFTVTKGPGADANVSFVGTTTSLVAGMYITQTANAQVLAATGNAVTISSVNSTAFKLNQEALASGSVQLWFAHPETAYSALAIEVDGYVNNLTNQIVRNETDYYSRDTGTWINGTFTPAPGAFDTDVLYVAKYPGAMGNSLKVNVCDAANQYTSNISCGSAVLTYEIGNTISKAIFAGTSNATANAIVESLTIGDEIRAGNASIGYQYLSVASAHTNNESGNTILYIESAEPYRLHTAYTTSTISRYWQWWNTVGEAPGQSDWVLHNGNSAAQDELHIVVSDEGGLFTGTPDTVLEVFKGLSRATDAKNADGSDNYYKNVINQNSGYVWWANDRSQAPSANAQLVASSTTGNPGEYVLKFGADGLDEHNVSLGTLGSGYDYFVSPEDIDIGIVLQGYPAGAGGATWQLANYILQNVVQKRRDCVLCISPDKNIILNQFGNEAVNLVEWKDNIEGSNYGICDSGYKYQYDRYNDLYRWVPLNGDIGGLCARTDHTNDPWWSPAGLNRGIIKNVAKLAYNPRQAHRDVLYPHNINPVITIPGTGTVLYGDKTLQPKPSAFDRINVRRLFIVLEKAIALASKYLLFEFNDTFTQNQFKNMVNPYLRQVQGRRGIYDFLVVCDATNNTPAVVDANQFVGDIYIKPARSINFIQLNFVAVATGVAFSEVVGNW
jgi:phage tail sheath protein FI